MILNTKPHLVNAFFSSPEFLQVAERSEICIISEQISTANFVTLPIVFKDGENCITLECPPFGDISGDLVADVLDAGFFF